MELIVNLLIFSAIFLSGVRVIQDNQRAVLYRFGKFRSIQEPGIYWILPFLERQKHVDVRTKTIELKQQVTHTKDNVPVKVKAVLWYKITDPKTAVTKVHDYNLAVYQYSRTTVRNTISLFSIDDLLTKREMINELLRMNIQCAARQWGVQIELLEIKELEIPDELERTMAREAQAARESKAKQIRMEAEVIKTNIDVKQFENQLISSKSKRVQMSSEHWYC